MEIWGGIECTLNRVGERFVDQFVRSGHLQRPSDLDFVAGLGLRRLRYPIHWERVQPVSPRAFDWSFADRQMARLQELGIEPIVGMLHHGSGPRWTNLLDPDFPSRLAEYASAVAARYPHVCDYTPVNEPLTTARFSALYGHWYPHCRSDRSFVQALLNEIDGIQRAMEAIRSTRPDARLVQTEDVSKIFSTPVLASQAAFENERRWITFDMLLGRFNEHHALWNFLRNTGVSAPQMERIAQAPVWPVILGLNYYVTSERWLDDDLASHPPETHGGNGRLAYADVAAVRGCPEQMVGIERIVQEIWQRYGAPMAITECHLGCTREEQVRWLMETWQAALRLESQGIDLRAVTVWALLGAFDWDSLVTTETDAYEPGSFDIRGTNPRPTLISQAVRQLSRGNDFQHPVLSEAGWWRRPVRKDLLRTATHAGHRDSAPILILGGSGNLGRVLQRICSARGLAYRGLSRHDADVCRIDDLRHSLERHRPWAVINASGYTLIDEAESDRARCFDINESGALNVAQVCAGAGLPCVTISTDLVFDGSKIDPYVESDTTSPLGVYGESKARGEEAILRVHPQALVIRSSPLFDSWSVGHFAAQVLLSANEPLVLPAGRISPTYAVDLSQALLDLLLDGESGIWHLANVGATTWPHFADLLFEAFSLPVQTLRGETAIAPRPAQSVLHSERGSLMPRLEDALTRFARDFQPWMNSAARRDPAMTG